MTFQTRHFYLVNGQVQQNLISLIVNLPIRAERPLEVVIREKVKARNNDQNNLMWASLDDIANQAWVDGRQFSAAVWHEFYKREYLPAEHEEGITKDGYVKWAVMPDGERVLVGSTTDLTTRGFAEYMEQIFAHGAGLGTQFKAAA